MDYRSTSSKRLLVPFLTLSFAVPTLLSCTNATPVIALLSSDLLNTEPTPPLLEITNPPENSYSQGTVNLTGSCTSGISVLISGPDLASGSQTVDCSAGIFSQSISLAAGDGSKLIEVSQTNAKGKTTKVTRTLVKDTVGPSVTLNQMVGQADPTAMQPLSFDLIFSEPVDVSGFLSGSVINGGTATGMTWSLADSGNHMNFILSATTIATSGTVIPSFVAGTFRDLVGNSGTASTSTDNTITFDTSLPYVLSVTSTTPNGTYTFGDSIFIQVKFSEEVTVSGNAPSLTLETGTTDAMASYSSRLGTDTLVFIYTIAATDFNLDLELANPSINGNGGSIKDTSANQASLSVPITGVESLSGSKNLKIVGTPASLTISDGPLFDFGNVFVGSQGTHTFTLTNSALSVVPATGITGIASDPKFPFAGGVFPGTGGNCTNTLDIGNTCDIVLAFIPPTVSNFSTSFSLNYTNGISSGLSVSRNVSGSGAVTLLTVTSPYPINANWNDYVKFADSSKKSYKQDDISCDGTETGSLGTFGGCIHAGEIRKVHFPGLSSCLNLTASDFLGVFHWLCDDSGSMVNFYSSGFLPGKGLRDLINGPGGFGSWKQNRIQVRSSSVLIGQSPLAPWWANPVLEAPISNLAGTAKDTLSNNGTIYYVPALRNAYIVEVANDKIALVTLPGATLSANTAIPPSGAGKCSTTNGVTLGSDSGISALLCIGSKKHLWIEADLLGYGGGGAEKAASGMFAYDLKHSRIHRTSMQQFTINTSEPILNFTNSTTNLISELELVQGSAGLKLTGSSVKNVFRNLKVNQIQGNASGGSALHLSGSADSNHFYDVAIANVQNSSSPLAQGVTVSSSSNVFQRMMISDISGDLNNSSGVRVAGGQQNIFVQLGAFSSTNTGLLLDASNGNIFSHYTAANHIWNGIYAKGNTPNLSNYFQSVVIANGGDKAIEIGDALSGSGNLFQSLVIAHSTTYSIQDPGTWFNWVPIHSFFSKGSLVGDNCSAATSTRCTTDIQKINGGIDLSNAFVGKASFDNINTREDGSGQSLYTNLTSLAHWLYFDTWLRGWGKGGSNFPATDNRGFCDSGETCQIWDWRVKLGSPIHNRSGDGDSSNSVFNPGAACPAEVHGNKAIAQNSMTFLFNAVEIDGDSVGNDNGLCESNESCIYAPNLGAYQGEGSLRESCTFSNGLVSNVNMRAFTMTGQ